MPYVNLTTTRPISVLNQRRLRDAIGETISVIPNKSYEVTMIQLNENANLVKGREQQPCLFLEIRLFTKTTLAAKKAFAEAVSEKLKEILDIEYSNMYINYLELNGWGGGGSYREVGE